MRLGAIFVPFNWRLTAGELAVAAADCRPRLLLHETSLSEKVRDTERGAGLPTLSFVTDRAEGNTDAYEAALDAVTDHQRAQARALALPSPDDPWTIIYTSGTTGAPKGVVLSHASATATMLGVIPAARVDTHSVSVTVLPMCHVAGLNLFTNPTLYMGGQVVLVRDAEPNRLLHLLKGCHDSTLSRVSHLCGVPAVFQFMQALPEWKETHLAGVTVMVGGAPVPPVLVQEWAAHGAPLQPCMASPKPERRCCSCLTGRRPRVRERWDCRCSTCVRA